MKITSLVLGVVGVCLVGILFTAHGVAQAATSTATSSAPFQVDLTQGSTHPDVLRLQQYLNTNNFVLASTGPGSSGSETSYFGVRTKEAVKRFQAQFAAAILTPLGLTQPTGNFFAATRSWLNSLLAVPATTTEAVATTSPVRKIARGNGGSSNRTNSVTITPSGDGNVTINPASAVSVPVGQTQAFSVTANTGFIISASVGGTCPAGSWTGSTYTTGAVTGNCTITFAGTRATYTVTTSVGSNLLITPEAAQTVAHGSRQAYTLTPDTGYTFGSVGGTCPAGTWVHRSYVTGAVTGACSTSFTAVTPSAGGASSLSDNDHLYIRQEDGVLQYSNDQSSWSAAGWPLTISNTGGGTLTVHLLSDLTLTDVNSYFVVNSNNIVFDGEASTLTAPTIVTVVDVVNYPGLIANGSSVSSGYGGITVSDVAVVSEGSTLLLGGGWLGQAYFGAGSGMTSSFNDCYSTGSIPADGGGIVGANSSGANVDECFATGSIDVDAGGIIGRYADAAVVSSSYSTSRVSARGGGIIGANSSNSTVQSSFSVGSITATGGGIVGASPTNISVSNSYTAGLGTGGGIIAGSGTDGATNYSESNNSSSGWSDTNAAATLQGVGTVWRSPTVNDAYILSAFDASPYFNATQTVAKGATSTPVLGFYNSCALLLVNGSAPSGFPDLALDADSGVVSVGSGIAGGEYDLVVSCDSQLGGYTTATLVLTIE